MAASWLSFQANYESITDATKQLGEVSEGIPGWITADIVSEMQDLKKKASSRLLQETTHGLKQTGLRASIAAGMKVVPVVGSSFGASLITEVSQSDLEFLPRGLDTVLSPRGWSHPVFGKKNTRWVVQQGSLAWFSDTVAEASAAMETTIQADLDTASKRIEGL